MPDSPSVRAVLDALDGAPLVVPGVGTPLEARSAVAAGFETVYVSGYATAAWGHGQPDVGLIALSDLSRAVAAVDEAVGVPIFCDADTGYGDVTNVAHTVRRLERLGASAIQIEDQTWPKRCGHLHGKTVIPVEDQVRKVRSAVRAREDPATMIIARTDAIAPNGFPDAMDRIRRYADAGADVLFLDAPQNLDQLERIPTDLAGHRLMVNMSESGLTPQLSAAQFYEMGYQIVLFPTSSLRLAARAVSEFFSDLRVTGDSAGWVSRMSTLDDLNQLVGLPELDAWEAEIVAGEAS